jgi:hypothetical protein
MTFPCIAVTRWQAPDVHEVATEVLHCLTKGDTSRAFCAVAQFLEIDGKAAWPTRNRMVELRPDSTGITRQDAMVAGVVEYACDTRRVRAPGWFKEPQFFLDEFWFVSAMRSLHVDAIVHGPLSFKRRGVFSTRGALGYA